MTLLAGSGAVALSSVFAIPFPMIDPVALELGPVSVHWYGLAYMAGLLLGWLYVRRLAGEARLWGGGERVLTAEQVDSLLLWATLGVVFGGRLGFVLFYEPQFYLRHPEEILAVWHGGMAFHGGLIGTGLAMYLFARLNGQSFLRIADVVAAAVPIGLFFGRIANFINGELFGRITDVPWAMVFPEGGPEPRHPSQLYEAALEGLVLFLVLRAMTHSRLALRWPGYVTGVFLAGYGVARSISELFREYDPTHALSLGPYLSPGIAYSIPMILVGLYMIRVCRFRAESEALESTKAPKTRG